MVWFGSRPRTGSPVCRGPKNRRHRPCHCKRITNGTWGGTTIRRWSCPICGGVWMR